MPYNFSTPADGKPTGCGGVLNALANFWLTRIEQADSGEREALPEYNLASAAEEALLACLYRRGVLTAGTIADGFEAGLEIARVLTETPFECETILRGTLDDIAKRIIAAQV